ncbi:MAG: hypothetical protein M1267_03850 [Candidatus Thermoplasmatota archaeon]|nr:hypothetical protein [Candidatus Thermoplasmatota archaeon]MCL5800333.1 hypothetical protein [Candidatus Thermoplasmatota archaeon]
MTAITLDYLKNLFLKAISVPTGLTSTETTLLFIALLAIGIALMFRGNESWKVVFTAAGLYLGGYFSYNVVNYLGYTAFPILIIVAIGAIIGAIVLTLAIRIGLSLGFAYLVYLVGIDLLGISLYYAIGAAVVGFVVAYLLYKDFVHVISGIVGAFAAYFAMTKLGISQLYSESAVAFLYVVGVALQEWERRRKKSLGKRLKEEKEEERAVKD